MTKRLSLTSVQFIILYSFLNTALFGFFFLKQTLNFGLPTEYLFVAFLVTWLVLFLIYSIVFQPKILKLLSSTFLLINAFVFYFMLTYNTHIDKIMFINAIKTDSKEISELINYNLFAYLFSLGIIPSIFIYNLKISTSSLKQYLKYCSIAILSIVVLFACTFQHSLTFARNYRFLKDYLPPINYIGASISYLKSELKSSQPLQKISTDITVQTTPKKPNLIVFIMGETSRAANFSLNGYHRPTNEALTPYLSEINYYQNTTACATATAVAVPCIFSKDTRSHYKIGSEKYTENILDIMQAAGYFVFWRDNDGGCDNVCDRIIYDEPCHTNLCTDDILLQDLPQKIKKRHQNQVIVLHTRGSHGPSYHLHYNEENNIYTPICTNNILSQCNPEELQNVYDNTVHYVSQFIANTINMLKNLEKDYNPMLIYVSDHGESLGENGHYLHAAAYDTAPIEQKEVPMLVWLPHHNNYGVNNKCLQNQPHKGYSHDNIFHSLLGISGIQSSYYNKNLDIFAPCK